MPDISATIHDPYASQGVMVFGIHPGEDPADIADFVAQTGINFPVVSSNTLGLFAFPQGVNYPYPRDIVIGKDLTVRSIRNSFNATEMEALVQQLLAE